MGCSGRFADNPGHTKEHRIERLTVSIAPRAAKAKKTRRVESAGLKSASAV